MLSETTRSDAVLKRLLTLHPKKIDLALDRILRLLSALGNPQLRLPPVIHVAGTNGKGSTIAYLRAILEAAGLLVHVYTSPYLVRINECYRLGRSGGGRCHGRRRTGRRSADRQGSRPTVDDVARRVGALARRRVSRGVGTLDARRAAGRR